MRSKSQLAVNSIKTLIISQINLQIQWKVGQNPPKKYFFVEPYPRKIYMSRRKSKSPENTKPTLKKKKKKQRHKAVSSVSKFIFMLMLLENSRKLMEQNRKNFSDYKLEIICGSGSQFRVTTRFF